MSDDNPEFRHGTWGGVTAFGLFLAMICFLAVTCGSTCNASSNGLERVDRHPDGTVTEVCG